MLGAGGGLKVSECFFLRHNPPDISATGNTAGPAAQDPSDPTVLVALFCTVAESGCLTTVAVAYTSS